MRGALETPAAPGGLWQRLYGALLRRRRERGRRDAVRLPRPAISVGNLHWGGTGKTPLVAAIAERLAGLGLRVAVLSRGYGRSGTEPLLVSAGDGPRVGWRESGDEPGWLASRLPGVTVAVGARREHAAALALESGPIDAFVLDDAFSHVRVARDLDLLVFPVSDPFGGARLLPSGRLREPLGAAAGADAVLLSGVAPGSMAAGTGEQLARALRPFGFCGPGFTVVETARVTGASHEPPAPGERVVLVTGVARAERVAITAQRLSLTVVEHLAFRDHHRYPASSLERIRRASEGHGASVLTTAKDAMKLAGRLAPTVPILVLELDAEPQAELWEWLQERIERVRNGPG